LVDTELLQRFDQARICSFTTSGRKGQHCGFAHRLNQWTDPLAQENISDADENSPQQNQTEIEGCVAISMRYDVRDNLKA
ncbi:MAG: hypothetical protein QOG58_995, partial [Caballeronia sp.]|nr:hypothetical protein [Caballeronia sp.]